MGNLCATFKLFSLEHFVYIFLAIAISISVVLMCRKLDHKQKLITIVLFSLMCLFVILEYVGRVIGQKDFKFLNNIPFNSIQVFTIAALIVVVKDKVSWIKFMYLVALPVSFISIIFIPNSYTALSTFSLSTISFVFANVTIIIFAILKMIWCEEYLYHKDVIEALMNFVIFVAIGYIINVVLRFTAWGLESDMFGTMAEKYNLYIEWVSYVIPIPFVCHLPLFAILYGIEYLCKIPFDQIKSNREHREQMEELVALGNLKAKQRYRESLRNRGSQILINNKESKGTNTTINGATSKESFLNTHKEIDTSDNK